MGHTSHRVAFALSATNLPAASAMPKPMMQLVSIGSQSCHLPRCPKELYACCKPFIASCVELKHGASACCHAPTGMQHHNAKCLKLFSFLLTKGKQQPTNLKLTNLSFFNARLTFCVSPINIRAFINAFAVPEAMVSKRFISSASSKLMLAIKSLTLP